MVDGVVSLDQIPAPRSPLYDAGVDRGDAILSIDGKAIATTDAWTAALARIEPGARVALVYRNRSGERTATLTAVADPTFEIVRSETIGAPLSPAQRSIRDDWLGAKH